MRTVPDWWIQTSWWVSGIFATGAVWYFLSTREYGIFNHCDYRIHTSKLEGANNKIKVIKRKAYGFHDQNYFTLKIYQAFSGAN